MISSSIYREPLMYFFPADFGAQIAIIGFLMCFCGALVRSCWAERKYGKTAALRGRRSYLWLLKAPKNLISSISVSKTCNPCPMYNSSIQCRMLVYHNVVIGSQLPYCCPFCFSFKFGAPWFALQRKGADMYHVLIDEHAHSWSGWLRNKVAQSSR